ncbi:hypothetical protein QBC38DRAFT_465306 [Podospora fimiseda]|uniref:Uncharacterized protein n=1 Tax=Podospora fimiseda TaxID=252190 RepID=A0AAN7BY90_9PEZI|nr:hypothetical protein QBC38DRAFT_465306 [Podospora fimiseda]
MQFRRRDNEVELTAYPQLSKYSSTTKITSSVSTSGHPHHKSRPRWTYWKWEIVTVWIAIAVIIAIFVILDKFDGRSTSEWVWKINLNTLTAILATILRAALMYPVAQIISQEKWLWFASSPKRLSDLDTFEDGSRGPWGALLLFPLIVRHRPLTIMAIFVLVLSLGIGSFVQQATRTSDCPKEINTDDVYIPVIQNLTSASEATGVNERGSPTTLESSLFDKRLRFQNTVSFFTPNGDDSVVLASCSAPECHFPEWGFLEKDRPGWVLTEEAKHNQVTHASMGLCSSCVDVSSLATPKLTTGQNGSSTAHIFLPRVFTLDGKSNFTSRGLQINTIDRRNSNPLDFTLLDVEHLNFMYRPAGQTLDLKWLMDGLDQELGQTGIGELITNASIGFIKIMSMSSAPCSLDPQKGQSKCLPDEIKKYLGNLATKAPADTGFTASTCVLYPCLRSYRGVVKNGRLHQTLLGVGVAERRRFSFNEPRDATFGILHSPCRIGEQNYGTENITSAAGERPDYAMTLLKSGTVLSDYPKECVYTMTNLFEQITNDDNFHRMNGTCDLRSNFSDIRCRNGDQENAPLITLLGSNLNATHDSIATHMSSYTLSVSNKLRREKLLQSKARGIAQGADNCFVFEWYWLTFPAALILLTVILLLIVILAFNSGDDVPVWKDSLLPLMLHGDRFDGLNTQMQPEMGHTAGVLLNINELEQKANTLHVKLNRRRNVAEREYSDSLRLLVNN